MLRRSEAIILPTERLLRKLLSNSFQDNNLAKIIESLPPEQRLVNILFDVIKLKETTRFVGGHIVGQAVDKENVLAKSAMVYQLMFHHGGPQYILRIDPVAGMTGHQLKECLQEVCFKVREKGGVPVALISDNHAINRSAYELLGGPGDVVLEPDGHNVILTHDFDHVFKNVRNNWFTEKTKELTFTSDGRELLACWKDIESLYNEDCQMALRLTKLSYTSVNPKPLQCQRFI